MRPVPTLWEDEAPPPAWQPLAADARCDVLVIGAGLAGLAVAGELRARGLDVLLVDAHGPGAGASARNAGFCLVAHPWEYPAMRERVGVEGARALIALARRSHARIEALGAAVEHRRAGSLSLTIAGDAAEQATLREAARCLADDGVPVEWIEPPQALSGFGCALAIPEDGEVHPGRLLAALARPIARSAIARIEAIDPASRIARAGSCEISFGRAVVATNAWARTLLPELEGVLLPHRAQVLVTAPLPRALERPCYACFGYDYFRQRTDGRIVLGGRRHLYRDAEATDEPEITPAIQDALERFLRDHLPFAASAPIERRWAGIMGFTPDRLPLVGPLPRAPEALSILAGFSGHGLGLAIACAERLAEALAGGEAGLPACLDPARFPTILRAR